MNLYICFSFFLQCTLACIALPFFFLFLSISIAHVKSHFLVVILLVQPVCLRVFYLFTFVFLVLVCFSTLGYR